MIYIDAIAALSATPASGSAAAAAPATTAGLNKFAELLSQELRDVNTSVTAAETAMSDLASGKAVELHEVMIALQRARLSVQTFVQVRNKLLESYQDLMRMQI